MTYTLYVFKTGTLPGSWHRGKLLNEMVWHGSDESTEIIDKKHIVNVLGAAITDLGKIADNGAKNFVRIVTSYASAQMLIKAIYPVILEEGLEMYDPQNLYSDEGVQNVLNSANIGAALCAQRVNTCLRKHQLYKNKVLPLFEYADRRHTEKYFSVSLAKNVHIYEWRMLEIYNDVLKILTDEESLEFENRAMVIKGRNYAVSYSIEGYGKRACTACYMDGEMPKAEPLYRQSTLEAYKQIEREYGPVDKNTYKGYYSIETVLERMAIEEMREHYPNPGDRFVKSCKIEKELEEAGNAAGVEIFYRLNGSFDPNYCMFSLENNPRDQWIVGDTKHHYNFMVSEYESRQLLVLIKRHVSSLNDQYLTNAHYIPVETWYIIQQELEEIIRRDRLSDDLSDREKKRLALYSAFDKWLDAQMRYSMSRAMLAVYFI